ncbi:MAG: HAMP domain-containing sensor histidine kinase [Pelobacteraceae bacterium]
MYETLSKNLLTIIIAPLLVACFFTGGVLSPFRFAYLPLMMLIVIRLSPRAVFLTGTLFACGYAGMAISTTPADMRATAIAVPEFLFYMVTAWTATRVARTISQERSQFQLAESTFQGLSNELSSRAINLQTTLDTLTLVHTKLQNIDRSRTVFLGNIAHELRTPLSGIMAYSEILLTYDDLDIPSQREFLKIINDDSVRMTTLVNDILNSLKIESGHLRLALNRVRSSELIEECINALRPMAAAKELTLEASIASGSIFIHADKNQVKQVLVNLVNNAIKYTQQGGVTVGVAVKGRFAEFFVTDTGEGIFPTEQEKIFDEFYRVLDNVSNRPPGTGLGLSICKKIVDVHEGTIGVESSIGKGSTFRFTIPLYLHEDQLHRDEPGERLIRRHTDVRRILVVVRNTVKSTFLMKSLEDVGYNTIGAYSYEKAYDLLAITPVDIIISDLSLSVEDNEPLLTRAASEKIPFYQSYFYVEPPGLISQVITGYIWSPFDRYQLLPLLESLKMPHKKISIISPDMDESRMLQMILGVEEYKTALSSNDDTLLPSCISFLPEAIIIGTFELDQVDRIVREIRSSANLANVPLILALKVPPPGNVTLIAVPAQGDRSLLFGLSPLVQKIEGELFK